MKPKRVSLSGLAVAMALAGFVLSAGMGTRLGAAPANPQIKKQPPPGFQAGFVYFGLTGGSVVHMNGSLLDHERAYTKGLNAQLSAGNVRIVGLGQDLALPL